MHEDLAKILKVPKKLRLSEVAKLVTSNPKALTEYLNNHTQAQLAEYLEIHTSRLSDVLLVLKVAKCI